MKCRELMKTDVECCARDQSVDQSAKRMAERNIGFMPVCDGDGSVVGTVTDRDIALRVVGERRDPAKTKVADVMTPELVCCGPDDDIRKAEDLMARHRKSRIVVADEARHPLGVISLSDLVQVEDSTMAKKLLSSVSEREARS